MYFELETKWGKSVSYVIKWQLIGLMKACKSQRQIFNTVEVSKHVFNYLKAYNEFLAVTDYSRAGCQEKHLKDHKLLQL